MPSPWGSGADLRPSAALRLPGIHSSPFALLRSWLSCLRPLRMRSRSVADSSRACGSEPPAHPRGGGDQQFGVEAGGGAGAIWAVMEDAVTDPLFAACVRLSGQRRMEAARC